MEHIGNEWSKNRKGPQIYLLHIDIFAERSNKRWFYAEYKDKVMGVLMLNKLDAFNGWVLNLLMLLPDLPYGTSEYIVTSALSILRTEGCKFLSVGTLPVDRIETIKGLNKALIWAIRASYQVAKKIFNLGSRQKYWDKFKPTKSPTFLLFSRSYVGWCETMGIMRALNADMS